MTHIHDVIHTHQGQIDKHMKEGLVFYFPIKTHAEQERVSKALKDICNEFESIARSLSYKDSTSISG